MKRLYLLLVFVLVFVFCQLPAQAGQVYNWQVYETDHFVIFYPEGYEFQVKEVAYYLEKSLPRANQITGNDREGKTRIILQDIGLVSNGYTNPYDNKIGLFTNSPLPGSELSGYQSWFRLVSGHELTHMRQITNYSGTAALLPKIFGNYFSPNCNIPAWLLEGITVYNESQVSKYEGRLNDGYYDAVVAAKARVREMPSTLEASLPHNYYPMGQWYVFGGVFMRYLANTYGEEKISEFFTTNGTNLFGFLASPSMGVDKAAKKVYGKTMAQLFNEWVQSEIVEHENWKTDADELITTVDKGYLYDIIAYNNKLYFAQLKLEAPGPYQYQGVYQLMEYDPATGKTRVLKTISALGEQNMHIVDNKIYYVCSDYTWGFANTDQLGYGITGGLYSYDLLNGETKRLFTDDIKAFAVTAESEIIYAKDRKDAQGSEIWRYNGNRRSKIGVTDQAIAEIEPYQNKYVVVSKANLGSWNINYLNLDNLALTPIIDSPWAEFAISFAGSKMYYSANYNSEYGLYEYDLESKTAKKLTSGGYASGGVLLNGEMYFKGVTHRGDGLFRKTYAALAYTLPASEAITEAPVAQFAATMKQGNLLVKDLTYLKEPGFRFFPYLVQGQDGLGLSSYSIGYLSAYGGLDFNIETRAVMPLAISLSNARANAAGTRETVFSVTYPLYRSTQNIIAGLDLNCYTNFKDELVTGLNVQLSEQPHSVTALLQGNVSNDGINTELTYRYAMDKSGVVAKASGFSKFDEACEVRGLGVIGQENASGASLKLDYTHRLFTVNKGIWSSNIYLGDIYGSAFTDLTTLDSGHFSVGGELLFETGLNYSANLVPALGLSYTDKGFKPFFRIKADF